MRVLKCGLIGLSLLALAGCVFHDRRGYEAPPQSQYHGESDHHHNQGDHDYDHDHGGDYH